MAAPVRFPLIFDEPANRASERIAWPVTVGVPFAQGAITNGTPVALIGSWGRSLPVQSKVLGEWRTEPVTPKWILLDFQAEFGRGSKRHFSVVSGRTPRSPSGVKLNETDDSIAVDTGAISFAVSRKHFSLLDALRPTNAELVIGQSSLFWVREDGKRFEARAYGDSSVVVETTGPQRVVIRAEGWYVAEGSEPMMKYQVRIAAFAGLPYVRIYHTLAWTPDDSVAMKEFGLSFELAKPATEARVGLSDANSVSRPLGVVEAFQAKYRHGELRVNGTAEPAREFSSWIEARDSDYGLAVSVRDMAMQLPKAYTITTNRIDVHLWAPQAGVMSMKEEDRTQSRGQGYVKEWAEFNKVVSPQGVARTHEIWLWPTSRRSLSCEAINDLIQRPPVAMADPVYQCSTDAIPGLRARAKTPRTDRGIEDGLDAMFRHVATPLEEAADFDLWNFGDVHLFRSGPWRNWDGGGYNWPTIPWQLFYRSGHRDYLEHAIRNARHVMDVDVCHYAPTVTSAGNDPAYRFAPYTKVPGYTYSYSPLHWAWGPVGDVFWTHPSYLLYCYYLTGYERAADVLGLMANANDTGAPSPQSPVERVSREAYGKIDPKTVYYEFTGKPSFLDAAKGWTDLALRARNKPTSPETPIEPFGGFRNNTFFGFFFTGLARTHALTGDPAIRDAFLEMLEPFSRPPTAADTAPTWGRINMLPFAFAARATGDSSYLSYPIHRIREQTAATQRTGDFQWYGGTGYSTLPTTYYPVFMEGALQCLGAWADTGFKPLPAWPGNTAFFASRKIGEGSFRSGLTLFVRKDAVKAGTVRLILSTACLSKSEPLVNKKMEARITGPDGRTRVVPLKPSPGETLPYRDEIRFEPGDAAGEYRIDFRSESPLFWFCPRSDLSGMVVWTPGADIRYSFLVEPARIYFRLQPGQENLTVKTVGVLGGRSARPLRIVGPNDEQLAFCVHPGPPSTEVAIPSRLRDSTLSLAKGAFDHGVWYDDLEGVILGGALEYAAVEAYQWFLPVHLSKP